MNNRKRTEKQQQDIDDYNRTAGRQAPVEEDGQTVIDDSINPFLLLVFVLIVVAAAGLLGWAVMIAFG